MNAADLNRELRGYTSVMHLEITVDVPSGRNDLRLLLAKDSISGSPSVLVVFAGVSELKLPRFGGQFMYLSAEDISHLQWDRLRLRVKELEHDAIGFDCASADIGTRSVIG